MGEDSLRVAIVAPPWYPVPPNGYGGIEQVAFLLAEELQKLGHEVTLYGRQGGGGNFELIPMAPESWEGDLGGRDQAPREATYLRHTYHMLQRRAFDIVHDNSGYVGLLMAAMCHLQSAAVGTLHGDLSEADGEFLGTIDRDVALVAISAAQRARVHWVRWGGVVHNAVDPTNLEIGLEPGGYLLDLARICPDKGQHVAIDVARRAGRRLVLAGKVGEDDQGYFREKIEPHLGDGVEWIENVAGREKTRLLAGAAGLLFPIQWEEPFGLAMIEAMASGTPVIATPRGAAVEVVDEGVTGFLGAEAEDLVRAVDRLPEIDRGACAAHARDRFSPQRMARGYADVYQKAIQVRRDRA